MSPLAILVPADGQGSSAYSNEADVRFDQALGVLDNLSDQFSEQRDRLFVVEPNGPIVQSLFAAIFMLRDARGLYERALAEADAAAVTQPTSSAA